MITRLGHGIISAMKTAIELPEHPDKLREFTLSLLQKLAQADQRINMLEEALKQARQARFGRKTEAFSAQQLSLLDEDCDADISALESVLEKTQPEVKETRSKPRRVALPESLPRDEARLDLESNACPDCGEALRFVRDEVNETLDYVPARFVVRKTVRPQYSCPCCQTMHSATLPAQVIDKGMAAPGLLAQVVIGKVIDHVPLDRQSKIYAREGIALPTSTLSDWMGRIGVALDPLAERLHELLLSQSVLHADETPLTVLSAKKGKAGRGYLWCYATPAFSEQKIVVFDCRPGRSGEYARQFLQGYQGTLVVDDYAGYKALFATGNVHEAGCMAHVRRKFFEQFKANANPIAEEALNIVRELYKLERKIKHRPPDKRRQWRQRYARPVLEAFHRWLSDQERRCAPNSGIHKAITHALKRWPALLLYLNEGSIPIDNNHVENCIRPIAVGRKNWMFAGSLRAGQRMAALMSLLHTARINGIDPFIWLHYILTHLPSWKQSQLDKLLPLPENSFVA